MKTTEQCMKSCSKLSIKTPKQRQGRRPDVFDVKSVFFLDCTKLQNAKF